MMPRGPRIAVRVDASAVMGTGHLRRCLSLAQALVELGAQVLLLARRLDEVAPHVLAKASLTGVQVQWLPAPDPSLPSGPPFSHRDWAGVPAQQDAAETVAALQSSSVDWLVIDHYAFDQTWHQQVRQGLGCPILVIDDLADRGLDAEVLLDHNLDADHLAKYAGVLRRTPRLLAGPRYALLSPVYRCAPPYRHHDTVRSLGVFMGGTDPGSASARVLRTCRQAGFTGLVEVVSSSVNPHLAELQAACAALPPTRLTLDEPDLSAFFARHDLQIGAGGGASWERCCMGVPSIGLVLAANQLAVLPELSKMQVLQVARFDEDSDLAEVPALSQVVKDLLQDSAARRGLGERAARLVDGRGAQRVALSLLRDFLCLRPAAMDDAPMLHAWRNHPVVRAVSGSQEPISLEDHRAWMERVLASARRWLFVAEVGRLAVGSIRFDQGAAGQLEVSLYLDPDVLGLGLGPRLLLAGEEAMSGRLGREFTVLARVLPDNESSRRLFEACGYLGGPEHYCKNVNAAT